MSLMCEPLDPGPLLTSTGAGGSPPRPRMPLWAIANSQETLLDHLETIPACAASPQPLKECAYFSKSQKPESIPTSVFDSSGALGVKLLAHLSTKDGPGTGNASRCGRPRWALWGAERHPRPAPTNGQRHPLTPGVITTDVTRHCRVSLGGRTTRGRASAIVKPILFFDISIENASPDGGIFLKAGLLPGSSVLSLEGSSLRLK